MLDTEVRSSGTWKAFKLKHKRLLSHLLSHDVHHPRVPLHLLLAYVQMVGDMLKLTPPFTAGLQPCSHRLIHSSTMTQCIIYVV